MTLEQMRDVDIRTVDPETLVDINDVVINTELPNPERILDFANQIGNVYCFKCGKLIVKIGYADTPYTIDDRMESYMRMLYL